MVDCVCVVYELCACVLMRMCLYVCVHVQAMAFLSFTVAAFGVAFILSLAFEAPMMGLEKLIFSTHKDK